MSIKPRFQVSVVDILLLTTLAAGIVAAVANDEPDIAFIVASCLGLFIWHRPVVAQLWVIGMIGLGAGLLGAGLHGQHDMHLPGGNLVGWGAGMLVGGFTYLGVTHQLRKQLDAEQARQIIN